MKNPGWFKKHVVLVGYVAGWASLLTFGFDIFNLLN